MTAAMDVFDRFVKTVSHKDAPDAPASKKLVFAFLSDGESTPVDYAGAKTMLSSGSLLTKLACDYASVHVLLVGIGANRYGSRSRPPTPTPTPFTLKYKKRVSGLFFY